MLPSPQSMVADKAAAVSSVRTSLTPPTAVVRADPGVNEKGMPAEPNWVVQAAPTQTPLLLLPILLAVLVLAQARQGRVRPLAVLAFSALFVVAFAPWTVRNWFVFHRFVLVASNGGSTFYGGNNGRVVTEPRYYGYWLSTTDLPHRDWIDVSRDLVFDLADQIIYSLLFNNLRFARA